MEEGAEFPEGYRFTRQLTSSSNGVYNPIYLGCQHLSSTRILPASPAARTIRHVNRFTIHDGGAGGELAEVHHCPTQKQEQWKPCPGEDEAYRRDEDRSDVGRMENGTYHYPLIWDNGTSVKR